MKTEVITPGCESVNNSSKQITLSETTCAYLKCLQQLDMLYECVYNALELSYGWQTADRILNEEYEDKSGAIRDLINSNLCVSIGEHINSRDEIKEI